MEDYKKMYFELFGKISDAIDTLKQAQQSCENEFINSDEFYDSDKVVPFSK